LTKDDRQSTMGKNSPRKPSGEDVRQSNGKITFTDRKKRDVMAFNETTEVRTRGQGVCSHCRTDFIVVTGRRAAD